MRVPSFAIICCYTCTEAVLAATDSPQETNQSTTDPNHSREQLDDINDNTWTKAETWGYATLANTFLVLLSVLGILILQCRNQQNRMLVTDFFIALAVSTMVGDAFFHILPHMLGLHGHTHEPHHDSEEGGLFDDHEDEHGEADENDFAIMTAKIGTLVGSMYVMWLIGALMQLIGNGHGHSHASEGNSTRSNTEMIDRKDSDDDEEKWVEIDAESEEESIKWSTIWGIMIGDCFHNFVDGIAVGVAWTSGIGAGLGTTVAIMMHEIPHELGDFVLYKKLGLSTRGALGLNVIAAVVSYGGLYLGLTLGTDPTVVDWLLALVAGLFIYIALVDVMPEMKLKSNDPSKFTRFFTQNIGLLAGFAMMILLALYEEDLENLGA